MICWLQTLEAVEQLKQKSGHAIKQCLSFLLQALEAIEQLKQNVDTLITIPNDKLLDAVDPNMPVSHRVVSARVPDSCLGAKLCWMRRPPTCR